MSVTVKIPTQMREAVGGASEIQIGQASSLGELMDEIRQAHPGLLDRITDEEGQLRRFVNVYVGDEDVRFLDGLKTPLEDGSVVSILPAVAGGAPTPG